MVIGNVNATPEDGKGWFVGPWNSPVPVAVGWAYLHFVVQAPFVKGDKVEVTGDQTAT